MKLSPTALRALEHLLVLAQDGVDGYRNAAAVVSDAEAAHFLLQCAARREEVVSVLTNLLVEVGAVPDHHGSVGASVHRGWVDIVAAMRSRPLDAVLRECERGEAEVLIAFRKVFGLDLPLKVAEIVQTELRRIRQVAADVRRFRVSRGVSQQAS